jgi:hypothetical protein
VLGSVQDAHLAPAATAERHDGKLNQNDRGAPTEGRRIAPEGLGRRIAGLPPGLQGIHSRYYGLDPS